MDRSEATFLRGFRRRGAEMYRAEIISRRADGSYLVRIEHTGGEVVAQRGNINVELLVGQTVNIGRTDGSGITANTGWSILSYSTTNTGNSSLSSRFTTQAAQAGETISTIKSGGVEVTQVTLTRGGAAVVILIYGNGLTSAATYGDAGITNDVAQVTTATLITIQVKASGGMAVGLYSLTVAGVTIPDFFAVI